MKLTTFDFSIAALDQCIPGGFNYLAIGCPQPPIGCPIAKPVSFASTLSPEDIESLSAFADQRELPPLDLHSRPKGKNGNAPRPPNAFMLFRSDFWKFNKDTIPERDHREISRITARCWNVLAKHRRLPYQDQAKKLKEEHALLYPQHKYNLSAKDRARKKPKQEIDGHDLCDLLAARVARDVKASRSPEDSGSSESGLLDQVMEQKVKSKRSRSASAAFGAEEAFEGKSQSLKPPAKKRKRDHHNSSTGAVQVPKIQPQTGISHPSISSFVPTNEIPALALPPSHKSPVAKGEPLQDQVPTVAAQTVTVVSFNVLRLAIPSSHRQLPRKTSLLCGAQR